MISANQRTQGNKGRKGISLPVNTVTQSFRSIFVPASGTQQMIVQRETKRLSLPDLINLQFGKKSINRLKYVNFLGVLVDEHLSWKYHINELCIKVSRTTGIFYKVRHYVPLQTIICLCNSLFHLFSVVVL